MVVTSGTDGQEQEARDPVSPREITRVKVMRGFRVNPRAPQGGVRYDVGHKLYVVNVTVDGVIKMWVVASTPWLPGWRVGTDVTLTDHDGGQTLRAHVRGVVRCRDMRVEGDVPNVPMRFAMCVPHSH